MKDKMKKVALIAAIFIQVALLFAFVPSFSWKLGNDCGIGGEFKPAGIYSISKVNADGTRTTRIYSRPINYRDEESNQWQPINAEIVDPTYNSETGLDGYITYDGSAYNVDTAAVSFNVGFYRTGGTRNWYRGYVSFDTSGITDTDTVISAKLSVKTYADLSDKTDWDNYVYRVDYGASLDATAADWDAYSTGVYQGNLLNTANYVDETFYTIPVGNIDKTGKTQFCIKSSDESDVGSGNNYIQWHSGDSTGSEPYLEVTTNTTAPGWASFSDNLHSTACDYFDVYETEHWVYMYATGFTASEYYNVIYWDGLGNKSVVDGSIQADASGNLSSLHEFVIGDEPGNWQCTVYYPDTYDPSSYSSTDAYIVADDTSYTVSEYAFYMDATAIPEFPTVMAGIVVAGLCFGIYYWMRKRRVAHVKT